MIYIYKNAEDILSDSEDKYFCVTTNGIIKKDGNAVMGAGIAKIINSYYPETSIVLGKYLSNKISSDFKFIHFLGKYNNNRILSFQTKYHWKDDSDIDLIKMSCKELLMAYEKKYLNHNYNIYLPMPGCSNGNLEISFVKNNIEPILNKIPNLFIFDKVK